MGEVARGGLAEEGGYPALSSFSGFRERTATGGGRSPISEQRVVTRARFVFSHASWILSTPVRKIFSTRSARAHLCGRRQQGFCALGAGPWCPVLQGAVARS